MTEKKKNIWKCLIRWILIVLSTLILATFLLLFLFSEHLIKKEISTRFNEKTRGQYSLQFEDLSINIFRQSITFSEIEIKKETSNRSTDFIKAHSLNVEKINLYQFLKNKNLQIHKIEIDSPAWKMMQDTLNDSQAKSPFSFIKQLSPLFNKNIRQLAINEIELTNAGFITEQLGADVTNRLSNLNFNVEVSNFYTDSTYINQESNFFKVDDIYLSINNFQKALADSIHELKIQKIQYSLKNKDIQGKDISLLPIASSKQTRTRYFVEIPEIKIKSNQLRDIFQNDSILIDSLFLNEADIRVLPQKNAPEINLKQIKEMDLYQLVEGEFKQLRINHLSMNAKKLRIEREVEQKTSIQEFYDLEVQLDSFLLNENSFADPNRLLYSTNIFLQIGNYYLLMNDAVHRFDASNIIACSENNFISANHLQLKPNQNPGTNLTTVDMECDSIRFINIDLKRLFHKREMPLQSILAYSPTLIINQGEQKRKNPRDTNSLLYHFIRNYIKGVYANVVEFNNGRFVINADDTGQQDGVISSDFNFKLTDFSLDSISAERTDKLFFATNIDLEFSNYNMKLVDQIHRLEIDKINVSTYKKRASIQNLHLFPDAPIKNNKLLKQYNRSQIYDIKIPYLVLSNTNIHQAFFRKNLRINNFTIIDPSINLEVFSKPENSKKNTTPREFYDLLNNYMENISIGKFAIKNGNIQLMTHSKKGKTISFNNKFSIELENFRLNDEEIKKNKLLFADNFELKIEDHLFQLSDNVHYLQASEIGVSSKRSEIYIHNAILYPDITSKIYGDLPLHFHISIPDITLQGVDLEEAYFEQKLAVDQFLIHQPNIKLYRSKALQKPLNFQKIAVPLPKEMQELSIKQFKLIDGHISIFNTDKLKENEILNSKISMVGGNNSLISQGIDKPASFNSDNISTTLSQLIFKPEKGNVNYTADQIFFSTKRRNLTVSNLLIKNTLNGTDQSFSQLQIPDLRFEQVNIEQILDHKNLQFKSIVAENPSLVINSKADKNKKLNLYQVKIPSNISPLISRIAAQQIQLNNAELIYLENKQTKKYSNIQAELNDFVMDTTRSERLLGAKSVNLNLKNYAFSDSKDYYNFHFGDINFNNQDNHLSVSNIQITPRYSKQQFQQVIPFQADRYVATIGKLDFLNIDLERWYEQNELTASQLIASDGSLEIFRDKRIPDDPAKHSKLPQQIIRDLEIPIYFDTIQLRHYSIKYEEKTPDKPLSGNVFFDDLNIQAYPVTNLPYMLNTTPKLTVKANMLLMGKAYMEATMTYDMLAADNRFNVSGKVHPFDMTILNPVIENTAGIAVRSGQLNRFDFDFEANQTKSQGKLRFAYDNLRVSILGQKDGETKEAKFTSFLTNSLVLKSKHPRTRILLPDEIKFNRDPQKSIVNYWWKSVFSGAKNTFGINENND